MDPLEATIGVREQREIATLATVSQGAIAFFALAIVALHFLRPEYHPVLQTTSEYAVGPYGALMSAAFLAMSVGTLALAFAYRRGAPAATRSAVGLGLLGYWGVAVLVAMAFEIDVSGAPRTLTGTIHRINGPIGFLAATAGVLLLSRRFRLDPTWRPLHRAGLALTAVMLAGFVAMGFSLATDAGFAGLAQRVTLTAFVTWLLMTAGRLRAGAV